MSQDGKAAGPYTKRTLEERAALNDELGFYPANLDDESVAEYRRQEAEDRFRHARWAGSTAARAARIGTSSGTSSSGPRCDVFWTGRRR